MNFIFDNKKLLDALKERGEGILNNKTKVFDDSNKRINKLKNTLGRQLVTPLIAYITFEN